MRPFFYHTDLGENLFFSALVKPIILKVLTILQDKLHSFNIKDDQSTRFLCTTNYSIDSLRGRREKGRGREKSTKEGKGQGAPAIRAGVFVIRPPFSELIP